MKLVIDTLCEAYGLEDIRDTMTVGDLISYLQDYDEDTPVVLSFDRGYTYGGIHQSRIKEVEEDV